MADTLRERRRQLLRDEILDMAEQLMAEKGYAGMSMEELASYVGVSKPTLYNQFPAKDDLVRAAAMRAMERLFALLDEPQEASPLARIVSLLSAVIQLQCEKGPNTLPLWMPEIIQMLRARPESKALLQRYDTQLVELVRAAVARGEIAPTLDTASIVRVFYALICAPTIARESSSGMPDSATMANTITMIFLAGVRARP
ncbi:TetR/AcrR family transcriptional regulator [Candidatus Gracilibacteria bacterium]|nr:TetR/AcrR family transcriptional regulator [Candidatus Gracilibacteria bacterium]